MSEPFVFFFYRYERISGSLNVFFSGCQSRFLVYFYKIAKKSQNCLVIFFMDAKKSRGLLMSFINEGQGILGGLSVFFSKII